MPILLLNNETIDKIAAGEVVERPLNVVKELVENSIDAGSTAISIEIRGGGIELIRVTDNGCGIKESECSTAFLRHATSKITSIEDLNTLASLGFRGEALSSISAVSKTEMITKTKDSMLGTLTVVEGGKLMQKSEVGAPDGTTFLIRSLFYNTPARKKFLKSPTSEAAMIEDIVEKFALSNPGIAFQLSINGKTKISTSGNGNLKDVIYSIFGKDVYDSLLPVKYEAFGIKIEGFTAKPDFSYQARNGELYFVNGRYVKSKVINTSIEEVYRNYLMQHRFPFCVLSISVSAESIDVNVHPQKLEVKFSDSALIADTVINALNEAFSHKELIPKVSIPDSPSVFCETSIASEKNSINLNENAKEESDNTVGINKDDNKTSCIPCEAVSKSFVKQPSDIKPKAPEPFEVTRKESFEYEKAPEIKQESLFEKKLISEESIKEVKIIGQVFDTYWIMTLDDEMFIVDQHAAHEKVNYENFVKQYNENAEGLGQMIEPPMVLHLSAIEEEALYKYMDVFNRIGFEIEEFGSGSYAVRAIPINLYGISWDELFRRLLDELMEKDGIYPPSFVCEKLASMSCKAAIKGGQRITSMEMSNLMKQILKLENPYNCPHGRPVFIKITKTEMEKKFKRLL